MPKPKEEIAKKVFGGMLEMRANGIVNYYIDHITGDLEAEIKNTEKHYKFVLSKLQETHTSAIKKTRKETIRECVGIVDNWKRGITNHNPNDLIKRLNNLKKYNE